MKLKNNIKFLAIIIILAFLIIFNFNFSYAKTTEIHSAGDLLHEIQNESSSFNQNGRSTTVDTGEIVENIVSLGQVFTYVGSALMVALITYMGIKYVTSGPQAQAKLRPQLTALIIAGCLIFGSYWIWKMVYDLVSKFQF